MVKAMLISDAVAITIVTAVPTTIAAIGAIIAELTRRRVGKLDETVKREGIAIRRHVQSCCHPDDLPPRASRAEGQRP